MRTQNPYTQVTFPNPSKRWMSNHHPISSQQIKEYTTPMNKSIRMKWSVNIVWCLRTKIMATFYVRPVNVLGVVGLCILTVLSSGIIIKSKRRNHSVAHSITSKSSSVKSVRSNIPSLFKKTPRSTSFYPSNSPKTTIWFWKHFSHKKGTLLS